MLATLFLTGYAWRHRDVPRKALTAIVLLGLVLRFFTAMDGFLHDWDERFHALVAKNMMDDPMRPVLIKTTLFGYDYKDWTHNHIWLHKPPLALWTMALSMQLFGVHEFALRLPSILFSTLSVWLTWKIALRLFPEQPAMALLAAFFQAVNGYVIELAGGRIPTDHIDTLLLFWMELGIWYAIREDGRRSFRSVLLLGLITGLAMLTKWLVALLIPFVFVLYAWLRRSGRVTAVLHTGIISVLALALSGGWMWYTRNQFPLEFAWEQSFNTRHLTEVIEGHSGAWWFFLDKARINWNEAIYLAAGWLIYRAIKGKRSGDRLLLGWMALPYMIFSASATKMNGYVLVAAPAVFIMLALFCAEVWRYKPWRWVAGIIVLLALRYTMERVKPFYESPAGKAQIQSIQALKSALPNSEKTIVWNDPFYIESMFYTRMTTMRNLPSAEELNVSKSHFDKVAVFNNGNLPPYILLDTSIVKISGER